MGDVGVKLPQKLNMHDAYCPHDAHQGHSSSQKKVVEILEIYNVQLDPPVTPKSLHKLDNQGKSHCLAPLVSSHLMMLLLILVKV